MFDDTKLLLGPTLTSSKATHLNAFPVKILPIYKCEYIEHYICKIAVPYLKLTFHTEKLIHNLEVWST